MLPLEMFWEYPINTPEGDIALLGLVTYLNQRGYKITIKGKNIHMNHKIF